MDKLVQSLRLVIPDGSMMKVVMEWLEKAGITVMLAGSRVKSGSTNVPFISSITLMRPMEIPRYLEKGYFEMAITADDCICNWQSDVVVLAKIPIGRATNQAVRIVLAVARESGYKSVKDLPQNAVVATEYVELTERYLLKKGRPDIMVIRSYGGTEQKVKYGADAIVDLMETGDSLVANGLVIIDEIMTSHTVIAVNKEAYADPELRPLIDWFVAVIKGVWNANQFVRIEANMPKALSQRAASVMGGMKAPTRSPVMHSDWVTLTSYVKKQKQHEVVFSLLSLGVKDICIQAVDITMGIN